MICTWWAASHAARSSRTVRRPVRVQRPPKKEEAEWLLTGGICAGSMSGSCTSVLCALGKVDSVLLSRNMLHCHLLYAEISSHINLSILLHQGNLVSLGKLLPFFQQCHHHLFWCLHRRHKPADPIFFWNICWSTKIRWEAWYNLY